MNNLEEFAEIVLKAVRDKADGTFSAWITSNTKDNSVKQTGISTVCKDNSAEPCVFLDSYYEEYQNGNMEIEEIVEAVFEQIVESRSNVQDVNVADFLKWETIRKHIYAKLINVELNKDLLGTTPHRKFMDLAVVYYIKIDEFENSRIGTILIQNQYMEMWGQDEESLYQAASANMRSDNDSAFDGMQTIFQCFIPKIIDLRNSGEIPLNIGIYTLSNQSKLYGASALLDKDTLKEIGNIIKDDFIVLPSSMHQVIILASNSITEYGELANMVQRINDTQINADERLSNHVYAYSRSEESLRMVA